MMGGHACIYTETKAPRIPIPDGVVYIETALCGESTHTLEYKRFLYTPAVRKFLTEEPIPVPSGDKEAYGKAKAAYTRTLEGMLPGVHHVKFAGDLITEGIYEPFANFPDTHSLGASGIYRMYESDAVDEHLYSTSSTVKGISSDDINRTYTGSLFPTLEDIRARGTHAVLVSFLEVLEWASKVDRSRPIILVNPLCRGYCDEKAPAVEKRRTRRSSNAHQVTLVAHNTVENLQDVNGDGETPFLKYLQRGNEEAALRVLERLIVEARLDRPTLLEYLSKRNRSGVSAFNLLETAGVDSELKKRFSAFGVSADPISEYMPTIFVVTKEGPWVPLPPVAHRFTIEGHRIKDKRSGVLLGSKERGFRDGPIEQASFHTPTALYENKGDLLVIDRCRIRMIRGGRVRTLAGSGARGFKDGPGFSATFHSPTQLRLSAEGVEVLDGDRIRIVQPLPPYMRWILTRLRAGTLQDLKQALEAVKEILAEVSVSPTFIEILQELKKLLGSDSVNNLILEEIAYIYYRLSKNPVFNKVILEVDIVDTLNHAIVKSNSIYGTACATLIVSTMLLSEDGIEYLIKHDVITSLTLFMEFCAIDASICNNTLDILLTLLKVTEGEYAIQIAGYVVANAASFIHLFDIYRDTVEISTSVSVLFYRIFADFPEQATTTFFEVFVSAFPIVEYILKTNRDNPELTANLFGTINVAFFVGKGHQELFAGNLGEIPMIATEAYRRHGRAEVKTFLESIGSPVPSPRRSTRKARKDNHRSRKR